LIHYQSLQNQSLYIYDAKPFGNITNNQKFFMNKKKDLFLIEKEILCWVLLTG